MSVRVGREENRSLGGLLTFALCLRIMTRMAGCGVLAGRGIEERSTTCRREKRGPSRPRVEANTCEGRGACATMDVGGWTRASVNTTYSYCNTGISTGGVAGMGRGGHHEYGALDWERLVLGVFWRGSPWPSAAPCYWTAWQMLDLLEDARRPVAAPTGPVPASVCHLCIARPRPNSPARLLLMRMMRLMRPSSARDP
jgi:hypothetical protein